MKQPRILNKIPERRLARIGLLLLAWALLATISAPGPPPPPAGPADAVMTATPVALDEDAPGRRRVGELVFRRGWQLASDERRFGGLSAMQIEGERVTAISDAGTVFRFDLPRAAGTLPLRIEPLPREPGTDKRHFDTEAMLLRGGEAWVAFERRNAIFRYRRRDWSRLAEGRPVEMRRWRANSGAEAMVRLPDGRFLLFGEGRSDRDPFSPLVLFDGDPTEPGTRATVLRYRRPLGFRVTDAALLPDGRLLVLNRRLDWLEGASAKLVVAETAGLGAGGVLSGREIATLRAPLTVDNMEALSVTVEGGRTIVRIASDDNFMGLQRTLLLEFVLDERPRPAARPRAKAGRAANSG